MKTRKKILLALGVVVAAPLIALGVKSVYLGIKNAEQPTVFTIRNDTDKTVKIYDCLTRDNRLEPGHSGTVQVFSKDPRGASCEIEDENSGERKGCLFAPLPLGEHNTILVSSLQPGVPSRECGIPK